MKNRFHVGSTCRKKSGRKKRGAALLLTLFTTAIVLMLGVSFLMLSISESRATTADKNSILALHMAKTGADVFINYMGIPKGWTTCPDVPTNPLRTTREILCNMVERTDRLRQEYPGDTFDGNKFPFRDFMITRLNRSPAQNDGSGGLQFTYNVRIQGTDATGGGIILSNDSVGVVDLEITQRIYVQGHLPEFTMTSTGRVFNRMTFNPAALDTPANPPKSIRAIQFRCQKYTPEWDVQGCQNYSAFDKAIATGPPPNYGNRTSNMVGMGLKSQVVGNFRVDGNSHYAPESAGNIQFFDAPSIPFDVKFHGNVSINANRNSYITHAGGEDGSLFQSKLMNNQVPMGLPDSNNYLNEDLNGDGVITPSEQGLAARIARNNNTFFRSGDNQGFPTPAGEIGHTAIPTDATWAGAAAGTPARPADIEIDRRAVNADHKGNDKQGTPGFARFVVELSSTVNGPGRVRVYKESAYTKVRSADLLNCSIDDPQLQHGLLYFEGGNVDVRSVGSGETSKFAGKLTIVAGDNPYREPRSFDVLCKDGTALTQEKFVYDNASGRMVRNPEFGKVEGKEIESIRANYHTPNSTPDGLGVALPSANSNNMYVCFHSLSPAEQALAGGEDKCYPFRRGSQWVFPTNGAELQQTIAYERNDNPAEYALVNRGVYRPQKHEGSIIIGGNILTKGTESVVGLVAKNWVLLNPDNPLANSKTLEVHAAIMSLDNSLQYDHEDMARKNNGIHELSEGKFKLKGSVYGQFSDVQGKVNKLGYTDSTIFWDSRLKYVRPPTYPSWTLSDYWYDLGPVEDFRYPHFTFKILYYQDLGATKVVAGP